MQPQDRKTLRRNYLRLLPYLLWCGWVLEIHLRLLWRRQVGTARPLRVPERYSSPEFHQRVVVGEELVGRNHVTEQKILGVCPPPLMGLHQLGQLEEEDQAENQKVRMRRGGVEVGLSQHIYGKTIPEKSGVVQPGKVCYPGGQGPLRPDCAVGEESERVLTESRTRPAGALLDEFEVLRVHTEDRGYGRVFAALYLNVPALVDDITCNEVVIVSTERPEALEPSAEGEDVLVCKLVGELKVLYDLCAN